MKGCDLLIEMKRALAPELPLIDLLCREEGIALPQRPTDSAFFMLIKDGNIPLGFSMVSVDSPHAAHISYLYIKRSDRGLGLGDGLLRASLNLLDLMGISQVLLEGHEALTGFLAHEGLKPILEGDKTLYYCAPREFFSRKCKGSERQ